VLCKSHKFRAQRDKPPRRKYIGRLIDKKLLPAEIQIFNKLK
jgi:hypothetical protein